ncbi:hypothetical protein RHM58_20165 [Pseudomonas sp. 10S4]|nr:hypothetical protein [Pseudomonas sp. 10S4]WPX21511.1 hypothetical protein RHM58_20165 [Pseudomonas sp. 10S4]
MSAALEATRHGLTVVVLDEQGSPGGKFIATSCRPIRVVVSYWAMTMRRARSSPRSSSSAVPVTWPTRLSGK